MAKGALDAEFVYEDLFLSVSARCTCNLRTNALNVPEVEDTVFKVPRCVFDDSPVFSDMFSVPQRATPGTPVDGSDQSHPVKLEGVKLADFRSFLKVFLPM
jgi:hypothetical protein